MQKARSAITFSEAGSSCQACMGQQVKLSAKMRCKPSLWATAVWRGALGQPQLVGRYQNSVQK